MIFIENVKDAVFDGYTFAREGNNTFNDEFVLHANNIVGVSKHDNLAAFWHIGFVFELRYGDRDSVNDKSLPVGKGFIHTMARNREAAENKAVDNDSADKNDDNKADKLYDVFSVWVSGEITRLHFYYYTAFKLKNETVTVSGMCSNFTLNPL